MEKKKKVKRNTVGREKEELGLVRTAEQQQKTSKEVKK